MIKLTPARTELLWIDFLPGTRLGIGPIGPVDMVAAKQAAADVYRADREAETKNPNVAITATVALTTAFGHRVIRAWEGIGDEAGEPIPVTAEAIDQLLEIPAAYDAFDALVLTPAFNSQPFGAAA